MYLDDLFQTTGSSHVEVAEGVFVEDAVAHQPVRVHCPELDDDALGPCPWGPQRFTGAGVEVFPNKGDSCLVVIATTEDGSRNPWIVNWWPYA